MPYNRIAVQKVQDNLRARRAAARREAEERRDALREKFPSLKELDAALSETCHRILAEAGKGSEGIEERIGRIRAENLELQRIRGQFLEEKGYPADYTWPRFSCPDCADTGYAGDGMDMCVCMKRELAQECFMNSGFGRHCLNQTFDNFDVSLYPDKNKMGRIKAVCMEYARSFNVDGKNSLLFIGGTGLGKTHLSSAIAHAAINRGCDVMYDTAQNILYNFERERFSSFRQEDASSSGSARYERTERYFECDLLICDDLGTEYTGNTASAALYSLLNTRIMARAPMIISTNLNKDALDKRYVDRIKSRIFGEFAVMNFVGNDLRFREK